MKSFLYLCGQCLKRKKMTRAVFIGLCACAMIVAGLSLPMSADEVYGAADTRLDNLIIDRVYEVQATGGVPQGCKVNSSGFSPDITEYGGTAYSSVEEIKIYPFAKSPTATVKVNDQPLTDGYVLLDIKRLGEYPVEVNVSEAGQETTYHILIKKVDTDYRERRTIVKNSKIMDKLSVTTESGDAGKLLEILKKDYLVRLPENSKTDQYVETDETYWETSSPPVNEADSKELASFTVDLGDVYSVSRIGAVVGPSNLNLAGNKARISVSTDGLNWDVPVTKGNLKTGIRQDRNEIRYELGRPYQARYIKYEITHWSNKTMNLRLYQFMIYQDLGKSQEEQPAPDGGSVPHQHEDRHQYLSSGQATVAERGLPLSGWTPSSGYGRGVSTREEAEQFGYDGPLFYDPDFENQDYMGHNPDALWGIAKAPFGGNNMSSAGEPREFIPQAMKPYINNAISFCFGDEGGYNRNEVDLFAKWFQWAREHYPSVILHSNQSPYQWSEAQLREYMEIAKPDMITWDDYYGDSNSVNLFNKTVQKSAARRLMNTQNWEVYRKLAHQGIDGSGSKPILFGQYLDVFPSNQPLSVKNMVANLSILSGAKWLSFFRMEYQFADCYLWDEDGTPTRGLMEWRQIMDRIHAVDNQINRLNEDWMMFKIGSIGNDGIKATGFRRGDFDSTESAAKNAEFGLKDISVKSLSSAHGGGTGDVVLGYFNTLPGLYESEAAEYFKGATAPKAFMVMNGLIAGTNETYNDFRIPKRELGSSDNTRQEITITVSPEFADKKLYLVDKDDCDANGDGKMKEVDRDADGRFTLTIGGGEFNLYFWGLDSTAKASSQSEGAYASFAFDHYADTCWKPLSAEADHAYEIENTFAPVNVDQVTITEKGNAIRAYQLEYLTKDNSWKPFGNAGSKIDTTVQVNVEHAVNACGIRLKILQADGIPSISDITCADTADIQDEVHTVKVNDNTMGTGLNRFQYDDKWSYREKEKGTTSIFPLESDGHFSNYDGAEARFQFYGTKVVLLLRGNQASNIKAQLLNRDGVPVGEEKKGNGARLTFDGLEQDVYTVLITKTNASQAGIDGAEVTYKGILPKDGDGGAKAVQVYSDQRTTNNKLENYFSYEPAMLSVQMPNNNSHYKEYKDENDQWVEHVQNIEYNNSGFTRTNHSDSSYSLTFYGTGVQLYASPLPVDGNAAIPYGKISFELDGKPVDVAYRNVTSQDSSMGTNANLSVRVAEITVPGARENGSHTLKVTVDSGYNRIDYAVVNRYLDHPDHKVMPEAEEPDLAVPGPDAVEKDGMV